MDLHYLKLFHTVACHLSLSRAAEELHISQPAVSIQIKKLENEVGFKLFERMGRQVYLTQSGRILYEYTTKIFDLVEQAQAQIYSLQGTVWGNVQVGASNTPGTYIMPRVLGKYKKKYPEVMTNLHIANTFEIENMVYMNQLDFAIIGGGVTRESVFHAQKVLEDNVALVVSPEHRLADRKEIDVKDLEGEQYITHERNSALFRMAENVVNEMGLPFNIAMNLGNIDAIKQAVASNLGIAFVPSHAVITDIKTGFLREIKIKGKSWKYDFYLIYHKDKQFSPAVERLMEMCVQEMKRIGGAKID